MLQQVISKTTVHQAKRPRRLITLLFQYALCLVLVFAFIFPLLFMVMASLLCLNDADTINRRGKIKAKTSTRLRAYWNSRVIRRRGRFAWCTVVLEITCWSMVGYFPFRSRVKYICPSEMAMMNRKKMTEIAEA